MSLTPYLGGMATRRRRNDLEARLRELITDLSSARPRSEQTTHLEVAVAALEIAQVADRIARGEIIAAREFDGATWATVAKALGVSTQTAHERFRTGPDGLHSRLFKLANQSKSVGGSTASTRTGGGSDRASSTSRAARTARTERS